MEDATEKVMAGESSTERATTEAVMAELMSTEIPVVAQNETVESNVTEINLANATANKNATNTTEAVEDVGPSSILYPGRFFGRF
jgi:hypothetical protein